MKKFILHIIILTFLTGCLQSTSMLGPTMTLVTTGNVGHALGAYATNKVVEEETGMDTVSFVSNKIEEKNKENKIKKEFKNLVKNNFTKTRKKLISDDQSNIFK